MNTQYTIKVYPAGKGREVYRNIEICGNESLDCLCEIILEAFEFITTLEMTGCLPLQYPKSVRQKRVLSRA